MTSERNAEHRNEEERDGGDSIRSALRRGLKKITGTIEKERYLYEPRKLRMLYYSNPDQDQPFPKYKEVRAWWLTNDALWAELTNKRFIGGYDRARYSRDRIVEAKIVDGQTIIERCDR